MGHPSTTIYMRSYVHTHTCVCVCGLLLLDTWAKWSVDILKKKKVFFFASKSILQIDAADIIIMFTIRKVLIKCLLKFFFRPQINLRRLF